MDFTIDVRLFEADVDVCAVVTSKLDDTLLTENHILALKNKPWWSEKHTILQKKLEELVPNTHLVAVPWDNEMLQYVINDGADLRVVNNDVMLKPMYQSACHDNCEALLEQGDIEEYHTGYALSSDRLWRFHSWGISNNNKIVETTEPRIAYLTIGATD